MLCSLGHSRNLAQRLAHGNCLRPVEWLTFKKSRDQGSGFFFLLLQLFVGSRSRARGLSLAVAWEVVFAKNSEDIDMSTLGY